MIILVRFFRTSDLVVSISTQIRAYIVQWMLPMCAYSFIGVLTKEIIKLIIFYLELRQLNPHNHIIQLSHGGSKIRFLFVNIQASIKNEP